MSAASQSTPAEILAAHVAGLGPREAIDLERLCREHPDAEEELRRLTAHWEQVSQVIAAMGAGGAGSLADRLRRRYGEVDPGLSIDRPPTTARPPSSSSGALERLEAHAPRQTRYDARGEIARGGMGAILEVWDQDLRRTLAMKVALSKRAEGSSGHDPRLLARFLEEAQITAQLDHPGIVPVHELGLDDAGRVFFTMPLVRGRDLAKVLDLVPLQEEGWTTTRALGVLLKVCEAMAYAHSKKVIHRDLKPANIMVGRFGEVYVMDWGLARVQGREDTHDLRVRADDATKSLVSTDRDKLGSSPLLTMDGDIVGTPSYMSPEQARGELTAMGPASDVYSIGAILYQLLAGHMPYVPKGSTRNALAVWGLLQEQPPDPLGKAARRAPEELVAICEKAMAREPQDRYPDTVALAEDLRAYVEGRVVSAHATGALTELRKWVERNRSLALTALAALMLVIGLLCFNGWRQARMEKRIEGKQEEVDDLFAEAQVESYVANVVRAELNQAAGYFAEARRRLDDCPEHLRGWEWDFLNLAENPTLNTIPATARVLRWNGDDRLVVGGEDGVVSVYGADRTEPSQSKACGSKAVLAIDVLEAGVGRRFVTGNADGTLATWERLTSNVSTWSSGDQALTSVAIAADGLSLFGGQGERWRIGADGLPYRSDASSYHIFCWDLEGNELAVLVGHGAPVTALLPLSDGRLVSGDAGGDLRVWDVDAGTSRGRAGGNISAIHDLAELSDGRVVSVGDARISVTLLPQRVQVWDINSQALEARWLALGHTDAVLCASVSPDGRYLVTGSRDRTVRVWNARLEELAVVLRGHDGEVTSVAYSPRGDYLATASLSDGVRVWDAHTRTSFAQFGSQDHRVRRLNLKHRVFALQLDEDSQDHVIAELAARHPTDPLVALPGRKRTLRGVFSIDLADIKAGTAINLPGHGDDVSALAWDPSGRWLASGGDDRCVRLWSRDATAGEPAAVEYLGFSSGIRALAWDSTSSRLAVGTEDGHVHLLNIGKDGRRTLSGYHGGAVTCLAWSRDDTALASGGADDAILMWQMAEQAGPRELFGHMEDVSALAFSGDGQRLFSGSKDRTMRVWHTELGSSLLVLPLDRPVGGFVHDREGRRIVIWDAQKDPVVQVFDTHLADAQAMWRTQANAAEARHLVSGMLSEHAGDKGLVRDLLESSEQVDDEVRAIGLRLLE